MSELDKFSDSDIIDEVYSRNLEDEFEDSCVTIRLSNYSDDELKREMNDRNFLVYDGQEVDTEDTLSKIYYLRRNGKPFEQELNKLIYENLGRIV